MAKLYEQSSKITVVVRKGSDVTNEQGNKSEQNISSGGVSGGSAMEGTGNIKTWRTAIFGSESKDRIKRVVKTNLTHALAISKQVADLGIEYYIGGLAYQTGDTAYQEMASRRMEVFEDETNIASSVAMGALYGSWGGPIGAVLGATLNGISTASSIAFKYKNREREFQNKVFKENNSIAYQRARANISLTTGRLR